MLGIINGKFDANASKVTHIDKNYYQIANYANLDPLERLKVHLNQRAQKADPTYVPRSAAPPVTVSVAATEVSALTLSITSMAKTNKALQDKNDELNRQLASSDDDENLFNSSSEDAEESNRNNAGLARQRKRRSYELRKKRKATNTGKS